MAKIMFVYPNEENCRMLEEMDLSYEEMTSYFSCIVTASTIRRMFKKYNIKHRIKSERIKEKVIQDLTKGASLRTLTRKYKTSLMTIIKIKKGYYNDTNKDY